MVRTTQEMTTFLEDQKSLPEAFFKCAALLKDEILYRVASSKDPEAKESALFSAVNVRVRAIATYLMTFGVSKGTPVAIISNTRPEWSEADLGILAASGITVSIYPSLLTHEVGFILNDSKAKIIFAENEEQVTKLLALLNKQIKIPAVEDQPEQEVTISFDKIISFEETAPHSLVTHFSSVMSEQKEIQKDFNLTSISRSDIASIVYTSGTTGPPKGVVQTHGNHLINVRQAIESGVFGLGGTLFLFLPLAHSFARLLHYIGFLSPTVLIYSRVADRKTSKIDLAAVGEDIRCSSPEFLPAVPRLFEKAQQALITKSLDSKPLAFTLWVAEKSYHSHSLFFNLLRVITKPLRGKIKQKIFGKNFCHAISGGAKLPIEVNKFFDALDILILEGYGLTETCVATNVNLPQKRKLGTVGPLFKDVEIQIAEDGEILFRGPNITKGYLHRPKANAETWTSEGWFKTGDIGHLDEDGFLTITDRKKDIIVTAGGKKVAPQSLEVQLKGSRFISQAVVVGDGKPYCVALFSLDAIIVQKSGCNEEEVKNSLDEFVDTLNKNLASFEQIKKYRILPEDLTVENGLLTPTQKPKRREVMKRYKALIDEMYK